MQVNSLPLGHNTKESMNTNSYTKRITTSANPHEVADKISRVAEWWGTNFEGQSKNVNDVFTVKFKNGDIYKVKVAEVIPGKKIVWDIIDAFQTWVKEPTEWVGTKILWEITEAKDGSAVHFTHEGLAPKLECFSQCIQGWDYLLQQSLSELLETGKGLPV